MNKKVFLLRDLSSESERAEKILIENGIYPVEIMSFSRDTSPTLISDDNSYSITGIDEITEYVEKYKESNKSKSIE